MSWLDPRYRASRVAPLLDGAQRRRHRLRNLVQSAAIVGSIGALALFSAYLLWGSLGVAAALAMIGLVVGLVPRMGPEAVMRLYGARPLEARHGGPLAQIVETIARRAELPRAPRLHIIPSPTLNAFATGTRENAAIAMTDGLLRRLSLRELTGVLGHEISHIRNNDLAVMSLADTMTRFTRVMSTTALFLAVLSLPLFVSGHYGISWLAILLLYLAPTVSGLLQLGLSRAREYDADLEGATLTGDPAGLASALRTLETRRGMPWGDWMLPFPRPAGRSPSLLRSHPPTLDRIDRLMAMARTNRARPIVTDDTPAFVYEPQVSWGFLRERPWRRGPWD